MTCSGGGLALFPHCALAEAQALGRRELEGNHPLLMLSLGSPWWTGCRGAQLVPENLTQSWRATAFLPRRRAPLRSGLGTSPQI